MGNRDFYGCWSLFSFFIFLSAGVCYADDQTCPTPPASNSSASSASGPTTSSSANPIETVQPWSFDNVMDKVAPEGGLLPDVPVNPASPGGKADKPGVSTGTGPRGGNWFNGPPKRMSPPPGPPPIKGWTWDGKKWIPPPRPEPPVGDPNHRNPPFVWDPKSGGYTVPPTTGNGGSDGTTPQPGPGPTEPTGPEADRLKGLGFVWGPNGGWTVPPHDTYGFETGPDGKPTGNVTVTDPNGGVKVVKPGEEGYDDSKTEAKNEADKKKADEADARRKAEEEAKREAAAERRRQRKALEDAFKSAPAGPAADAAAQAIRDFDNQSKKYK